MCPQNTYSTYSAKIDGTNSSGKSVVGESSSATSSAVGPAQSQESIS
jgi:hypothetical protein